MSMALKASRARAGTGPAFNRQQFRGDPGLFGDIFKKVTSFVRDPVGTLVSTAVDILSSGGANDPPPKTMAQSAAEAGLTIANGTIINTFQQTPPLIDINFPFDKEPGFGIDFNLFGQNGGGSTATAAPANGKCQSGFHLNKATYFLKSGQRILKGTVCVKNRRRNALNDRAASNAIKRLEGARKAIKNIQRVSIRCGKGSCVGGKCVCK